MVTRVTRGWSRRTTTRGMVAVPGLPMPGPLMTESALSGIRARISEVSVPVAPVSAMLSIPGVAVSPLAQKRTPSLCTAPMRGEKCGPRG